MSTFGDGTPKQEMLDKIKDVIYDHCVVSYTKMDALGDLLDVVKYLSMEWIEDFKDSMREEVREEVKRELRDRLF